jgi:signal peptidase I
MSESDSSDGRTTSRVSVEGEAEEVPQSWLGRQLEGVNTLFVAVLIALAIRAFVIEPFRIPSGSMLPTLLIGDHLFVNKFVYGVKVPFAGVRLPKLRDPERGDVVVFTVARDGPAIHPVDRRPDLPREEFVKRVVALPGDTVEVDQGILRVNGEAVERVDVESSWTDEAGRSLAQHTESADGRAYTVLDDPLLIGLQQRRFTVEPGRYFLMGDNRDHSNDSRNWGTVDLDHMKGPAFVLYWSWNYNGGWLELANPLTWLELFTSQTRWDRIGAGID